jgi:hypothetical protein
MTVRELIDVLQTMPADLSVQHYDDIVQDINSVVLADVSASSCWWKPATEPPPANTERCVVLSWEPS